MSILEYSLPLNQSEELFVDMVDYARRENVPIIDSDALNVLKTMIRISNTKTILEIGTAIGYSALHMSRVSEDIRITTIEKDAAMFNVASQFLEKYDTERRVNSIQADAKTVPDVITDDVKFDMLFIDASKGNNRLFFDTYSQYVNDDGLIIVDNYYARGIVTSDDIKSKNIQKLKEKVDTFNQWIYQSNYQSSFIPVGDGLIIISKDKGERL